MLRAALALLILNLVFAGACAPKRQTATTPAPTSAKSPGPAPPGTPINRPAAPAAAQGAAQPSAPAPSTAPAAGQPASPFGQAPAATPSRAAPAESDPLSLAPPPTGFGGLAWGTRVEKAPGLVPIDKSVALRTLTCLRQGEPPLFENRPTRRILYEFFEGAFYHAWVEFDGEAIYHDLLAILSARHGRPQDARPDKFYNAWSLGEVNIYLVYHPNEGQGDVSYWYEPIYAREALLIQRLKSEAAKKGQ